jgi:predicted nucleotidyltransferase
MQTKSPSLLPILRSRALADLLAILFVAEERAPLTITGLAAAIGSAPSTVKREVDRLEETGIVITRRVGRNRGVLVNSRSPLFPELRALMLKAFGPLPVLRERLEQVDGIDEAHIFGSWARRYRGERGPVARDVDVVVVGDIDPNAVYHATAEAERILGLEVNPTILDRDEWEAAATPFLETIRAGPLVPVVESA